MRRARGSRLALAAPRQHGGVQELGELAHLQARRRAQRALDPLRRRLVAGLDLQHRERERVLLVRAVDSRIDRAPFVPVGDPARVREGQVDVERDAHGVVVGPLERDAAVLGSYRRLYVFLVQLEPRDLLRESTPSATRGFVPFVEQKRERRADVRVGPRA